MPNPGDQLEDDVQGVYQWILNHRGEGIIVEKKKRLQGHLRPHIVDVYYEFQKAGVTHRVVIECKDHGRPIEPGDLYIFQVVLGEVANGGSVIGIMISRHGFSKSVRAHAQAHGIQLLRFDELPRINTILGDRLEAIAFPEKGDVGEPFWTIMRRGNGPWGWSGQPLSVPAPDPDGPSCLPLFLSKPDAEVFLSNYKLRDPSVFGVCGLRKIHLRTMLLMTRACSGEALLISDIVSIDPFRVFATLQTLEQVAEKHLPGTDALIALKDCPRIRDFRGIERAADRNG